MIVIKKYMKRGKRLILLFSLLILTAFQQLTFGQEKPPRPILLAVNAEGLRFGAFCQGSLGGTVIINPGGGRDATGDIIKLSLGHVYGPATFRVKGNAGTLVTIADILPCYLYNGGYRLRLSFGNLSTVTSTGSPFILTSDAWMDIKVGGTLTVGNAAANPPGEYSGTFDVTFIQN